LRVERCAERSRHLGQGHEDQSSPKGDTLEKLNDRFQHLIPDPHNQIPRPFYHRIHNGAFTLSCPLEIKGLSVNRPLGTAPDFEAGLVARIEQNRRRSSATSKILRLRSGGKSRPKAGCERKGVIYGQALSPDPDDFLFGEFLCGELADFPWDTAAHPGTVEQGDYHVGII
jgi:hypothetical protein